MEIGSLPCPAPLLTRTTPAETRCTTGSRSLKRNQRVAYSESRPYNMQRKRCTLLRPIDRTGAADRRMTTQTETPRTSDRIEKQFQVNAQRARVWRAISDAGEFGT